MPRAPASKAQKTAKATKTAKVASKSPSGATKKAAKVTKAKVPKAKKAKAAAFLPLQGSSFAFVDFKDKSMEDVIKGFGGTITKSMKTADCLVCDDVFGDKACEVMAKYSKHDYARSKEDVQDQLEEYAAISTTSCPELAIGKTTIQLRVDWFTEKGVPIDISQISGSGVMVYEDEACTVPFDCCYHDDGNAKDMYTRLSRLQLLHDETEQKYRVITKSSFLEDVCSGNNVAGMISHCAFNDLDEAVNFFVESFKGEVGFTWRNRATCKPKKGAALLVNLDNFVRG